MFFDPNKSEKTNAHKMIVICSYNENFIADAVRVKHALYVSPNSFNFDSSAVLIAVVIANKATKRISRDCERNGLKKVESMLSEKTTIKVESINILKYLNMSFFVTEKALL